MPTAPTLAPAPDGDGPAGRRRAHREWFVLVMLWLALGAGLAVNHGARLDQAERRETQRLTATTRTLALNLTHQLDGAQASLRRLRDDLGAADLPAAPAPTWPASRTTGS